MIYIFIVCAFVSVIYSFPSPKGIMVTDDMLKVFNSNVTEVKLDDFESYADDLMEKFLDEHMCESNISSNIPNIDNESNGFKDLDDITPKDIFKASMDKPTK